MVKLNLIAGLSLAGLSQLALALVVTRQDAGVPAGYTVGFSTQDGEPVGQQSICTTTCSTSSFLQSTSTTIGAGTYAAAINSALGGGADDCSPCGTCYSIINAGVPYCNPDPYDPNCGAPSGNPTQGGAGGQEIKVMITNHCTDCKSNQIDINNAPAGWDNPKIYFKALDPSACR